MSYPRPRLTPHQKEVLMDLTLSSRRNERFANQGWVDGKDIGARAALDHLVRKGYADKQMRYGPRGGQRPHYRPIPREMVR